MKFQAKAFLAAIVCGGLSCVTSGAMAADWGNLSGHFVVDGKAPEATKVDTKGDAGCTGKNLLTEDVVVGKGGDLENVLIYLRTKKPAIAPEYEKTAKDKVVLDNKNCRFEPHVVILRTSQTLELKNSDPFGHNTKIDPLQNAPSNDLLPAGAENTRQLATEEALPVKVGCNIHPWMGGWVLVRDNPYAAKSDDAGKFTIKDLPVGTELEFQLWQEKSGFLKDVAYKGGKADGKGRFKITIKKGENDLGDIKVPAALLTK